MDKEKDIIEKLNEIALEMHWGLVERIDGVPKPIAVIQEAIQEIERLRNSAHERVKNKKLKRNWVDYEHAISCGLG